MSQRNSAEDAAEDLDFEGNEWFPNINVAAIVDHMIATRGYAGGITHAASVARAARALKEDDAASDWEQVVRILQERQRGI